MSNEWNPRYVCYCKANNKTPEEMLDVDRNRWPGGSMIGFMLWIQQKWLDFAKLPENLDNGKPVEVRWLASSKQDEFDAWLQKEGERESVEGFSLPLTDKQKAC